MRKLLVRLSGLLLLIIVAGAGWFGVYVITPATGVGEAEVLIPRGVGVREIKTILGENGVIRDDMRFLLLARLSGLSGKLRAGEYRIALNLQPLTVLRILAEGEVLRHRLTIPEGMCLRQIAEILAKDGWVDQQQFLRLVHDRQFIRSLGLKTDILEGYIFPDTYMLTRSEADAKVIITLMVKRFERVWRELEPYADAKFTRHQVVTLASIVEKETGVAEERPLIAKVFLNRLRRGMKLQSDPTVIYGIEDFNGNLTRADLKRSTPYNTYVIRGLPPGPICSPGREAMMAVLRPAESSSLYFVSKNDGTHYFSQTLREHNRAVRKYQLKR